MCKSCHKDYRKTHYEANKQKYIDKARKWEKLNGGKKYQTYKISNTQFLEMYNKYAGLCWICKTNTATHIDHDHSCCPEGKSCGVCVRGLICNTCNTGLGMFKDNVDFLQGAIDYLYDSILPSSQSSPS